MEATIEMLGCFVQSCLLFSKVSCLEVIPQIEVEGPLKDWPRAKKFTSVKHGILDPAFSHKFWKKGHMLHKTGTGSMKSNASRVPLKVIDCNRPCIPSHNLFQTSPDILDFHPSSHLCSHNCDAAIKLTCIFPSSGQSILWTTNVGLPIFYFVHALFWFHSLIFLLSLCFILRVPFALLIFWISLPTELWTWIMSQLP